MKKYIKKLLSLPDITYGRDELKKIEFGSTRIVFEIKRGPYEGKVIKFARTQEHIKSNKNEVLTWESEKNRNPQYFCPILEYDRDSYRWLIMDKANTTVNGNQARIFREKIKKEYDGLVSNKKFDLISLNMGFHGSKNKIKLIDYSWGEINR